MTAVIEMKRQGRSRAEQRRERVGWREQMALDDFAGRRELAAADGQLLIFRELVARAEHFGALAVKIAFSHDALGEPQHAHRVLTGPCDQVSAFAPASVAPYATP